MNNHDVWDELYKRVHAEDFALKSIKLVKVSEQELYISSPTSSLLTRVREKYIPLIADTWLELTGNRVTVKVSQRDATRVAPVFDDGQLVNPKVAEYRKMLRRRQAPAEFHMTAPIRPPLPKKDSPVMSQKRIPNKVKVDVIVAAVKQYYNLGEIRFLLPYPDERLKLPRLVAMYLTWIYLGEGHNAEIGIYFGISAGSVGMSLKKAARAEIQDTKFRNDLRGIKDLLKNSLDAPNE